MSSINVVTFNVHYVCQSPSSEKVASAIATCGADVVCLQETNSNWESFLCSNPKIKSIFPHIRFHNVDGNPWGGFACLSVYPINSFQVIPQTDRGWYPAGCVTVQCFDDNNRFRLLQLLIVHLRAPVEWRSKPYWWGGHANWIGGYFSKKVKGSRLNEIQTFLQALQPSLPTVIVGDFNECRNGGCLQYLKEQGYCNTPKAADTRSWGFCETNSWSWKVGPVTLLSFDYDHIFFSHVSLESVNSVAMVHHDCGSDHCLVSARFQLKNA
jgi:endonuclease/exonuclease/phosphatase family metal-dependent hydrolase